jgi:4-amino-4-deoxy-L-arabinose transferase-like glycosyltransferase
VNDGAAQGRAAPGRVAPDPRARWTYLGLSALVAVLWFAMLPLRPLFNPDEGRYAEIPREMLAGGDWVIPHLNGLAYIEKPPLQYWATAAALSVFGRGEFAARFYTACCALATLSLVWLVAWTLWQTAAAWRAAAVLSSTVLFVVLGQLLTLDMSLTFYMTLSLAGFLLAQPAPMGSRSQRRWMLVAWGAAALGSIPWTLPALRVVAVGWRRRVPRGQFDPVLFLWIWVVFICLFFSLSDSKLIPYILPAMPGLALLVAASPAQAQRRDVWVTALLTLVAACAAGAASLYGPRLLALNDRSYYFGLLAKPLAEIAALLAASGLYVLLKRRRDPTQAAVVLGAGWCLAGLMLMRAAGVVAPLYSGVILARAVGTVRHEVPVYCVGLYDQTLPFYWQHTFKLVAYRGELDFGLRRDPKAEIPSVVEFVDEWRRLPEGFAVMEKSMFDHLEGEGVPMREVARDVRRVLVARK